MFKKLLLAAMLLASISAFAVLPDFALVTDVVVNTENTNSTQVQLSMNITAEHNGVYKTDTIATATFIPSVANANAAIVSAATAYFQKAFGVSLINSSVVYTAFTQGS